MGEKELNPLRGMAEEEQKSLRDSFIISSVRNIGQDIRRKRNKKPLFEWQKGTKSPEAFFNISNIKNIIGQKATILSEK